jgi:hypothetical protein
MTRGLEPRNRGRGVEINHFVILSGAAGAAKSKDLLVRAGRTASALSCKSPYENHHFCGRVGLRNKLPKRCHPERSEAESRDP